MNKVLFPVNCVLFVGIIVQTVSLGNYIAAWGWFFALAYMVILKFVGSRDV